MMMKPGTVYRYDGGTITVLSKTKMGVVLHMDFERERTKMMPVKKFEEYLEENPPQEIQHPSRDEELVAVCGNCHRESCFQSPCRSPKKVIYKTRREIKRDSE